MDLKIVSCGNRTSLYSRSASIWKTATYFKCHSVFTGVSQITLHWVTVRALSPKNLLKKIHRKEGRKGAEWEKDILRFLIVLESLVTTHTHSNTEHRTQIYHWPHKQFNSISPSPPSTIRNRSRCGTGGINLLFVHVSGLMPFCLYLHSFWLWIVSRSSTGTQYCRHVSEIYWSGVQHIAQK